MKERKNANIRSRPQYKSQAIHIMQSSEKKNSLFIIVYHHLQAPLHKDLKAWGELTNSEKYNFLKQVMIITVLKLRKPFYVLSNSLLLYIWSSSSIPIKELISMQELDGLKHDAVVRVCTHCAALLKLSAMDVFCQIIACSRFSLYKASLKAKGT